MKLNVKVRNGTRNGTRQAVVLWFILDELMTYGLRVYHQDPTSFNAEFWYRYSEN